MLRKYSPTNITLQNTKQDSWLAGANTEEHKLEGEQQEESDHHSYGDSSNEPVPLPINGILDLHSFHPSDLGSLIPEYIDVCLEKNIHFIRIIHGKGRGVLRRSVHALLERHPAVVSYSLAGDRSSWGATLVELSRDQNFPKQP